MIKDTVIWILFIGLPWFFHIGDLTSDADFFKNRINEMFKWTIIVEFIINLYINVWWIEFILIFTLVSAVVLEFSMKKVEEYGFALLFNVIFYIVALLLFLISIFNISMNITDLSYQYVDWIMLSLFSLPILLSLMYSFFLYILILYMQYESFNYKLIRFAEEYKDYSFKKVFRECNFHLDKLIFFIGDIKYNVLVSNTKIDEEIIRVNEEYINYKKYRLITIIPCDVHIFEKGEPANDEGLYVAIKNKEDNIIYSLYPKKAFLLDDDFNKPFKAKYKIQKVGLNRYGHVITEVYDIKGKKLK